MDIGHINFVRREGPTKSQVESIHLGRQVNYVVYVRMKTNKEGGLEKYESCGKEDATEDIQVNYVVQIQMTTNKEGE